MSSNYLAVLRHGKAANNDAETRHKEGDATAYDAVVTTPSALHDLIPTGIEQAKLAGRWIKQHQLTFDRYIVSGYLRALHTAMLLDIPEARWEIEDRICEKDGGILNAMKPHEVEAHFNDSAQKRHARDNYRYRPARGESFLDLEIRVRSYIESLTGRPLIVCHGHVMRIIDRIIMRGQCSWDFGSFKDTRGDLPNGVLIEYQRNGTSWERRISIPSRNSDIGTWEPIVRPTYSNDALGVLIDKVRTL